MGAGIAGCLTALELAEREYNVIILDKREDALEGSSDHTPARLGLGFHYSDIETALKYFHATLEFLKKHPQCRLSSTSSAEYDPIQHGRYFIMKEWDETKSEEEKAKMTRKKKSEIYGVWEALKEEYTKLCKEDPANKIFGEPSEFYKELEPAEIAKLQEQGIISSTSIASAIETAEGVLDWGKLKNEIKVKLKTHPNIKFIPQADIYSASQLLGVNAENIILDLNDLKGYQVSYKDKNGLSHTVVADGIANCSWESIDYFRQQLSAIKDDRELTHRLKVMIEVELPEILQKTNSMFFCFGPHASETNCGDGRGFITYEPVTNYLQSGKLITPEMERFLYADSSNEEVMEKKKELANKILEGVSQYIPAIGTARINKITAGIVRTFGNIVDINSPTGAQHQRRESGVIEGVAGQRGLGIVENGSMKLIYGVANSEETAKIFDEIFLLEKQVEKLAEDVVLSHTSVLKDGLNFYLKKIIMDAVRQGYITTSLREALTDGSLQDKMKELNTKLMLFLNSQKKDFSTKFMRLLSSQRKEPIYKHDTLISAAFSSIVSSVFMLPLQENSSSKKMSKTADLISFWRQEAKARKEICEDIIKKGIVLGKKGI